MPAEQIRECQACGHRGPCTKTKLGRGVAMWLCADNRPHSTCIAIAVDKLLAQTMIDERFALGYALGRHDAGDIRARARETDFARDYGIAMQQSRLAEKTLPSWARCFENWLETGKIDPSSH